MISILVKSIDINQYSKKLEIKQENRFILQWEKICNILVHPSLWYIYLVNKTVQIVEGTHYGCLYYDSWCSGTLCEASGSVWFESYTDKHAVK